MINLQIVIDKKLIIRDLKVTGHCGFDIKSRDIACAGVSALVYSVLVTLKKYKEVEYELTDNKDILSLKIVSYVDKLEAELRGMSITFVNGIKLIEKKFLNNIKLTLI